jgi:hypothetical protein
MDIKTITRRTLFRGKYTYRTTCLGGIVGQTVPLDVIYDIRKRNKTVRVIHCGFQFFDTTLERATGTVEVLVSYGYEVEVVEAMADRNIPLERKRPSKFPFRVTLTVSRSSHIGMSHSECAYILYGLKDALPDCKFSRSWELLHDAPGAHGALRYGIRVWWTKFIFDTHNASDAETAVMLMAMQGLKIKTTVDRLRTE